MIGLQARILVRIVGRPVDVDDVRQDREESGDDETAAARCANYA
jgi:hypothetical protein